jgi:RNA-directed DNA polymerase
VSFSRLIRYADDFVVCVSGERRHAEELIAQTEQVIAPLGLKLSREKTRVVHIDEGMDFLGWRINRQQRGSDGRRFVYTYPSKRSLMAVKAKVRQITRSGHNQTPAQLLYRLNPVHRGWCAHFRCGVSSQTFAYLDAFTWRRVTRWLRCKYPKRTWRWLIGHYLPGWRPTDGPVTLFRPAKVATTRYRYRGAKIATPWEAGWIAPTRSRLRARTPGERDCLTPTGMPVESPVRWKPHAGLYVERTVMLSVCSAAWVFPAERDFEG